jgi:hypothetical protein
MITSLVGSLTVASAVGAVWQAGQATRATVILPAEDVWTDARITALGSQSMSLAMEDGQARELRLDFGYTSVFHQGGVLSIAHLRQGQQVKVLSSRSRGTMMAKAIEVRPLRTTLAVH